MCCVKTATASTQQLHRQYQRLRASLARINLICQGTVLARYDARRASNPNPYYQWTRKQTGKTSSMNLSREQYDRLQQAIAQNRKLEDALQKMRMLSQAIIFQTAPDINRHNPSKTKALRAI